MTMRSPMRPSISAITALLLLLSSLVTANSHSNSERPIGKRDSHSGPIKPRRPNPVGSVPLSSSRLASYVKKLKSRTYKKEGKRDPSLGPGPGPDRAIAARNRARKEKQERLKQKRQLAAANSTVSAPQASATLNSTTAWIPDDVYTGSTFWNYFSFFTGADPTHGTVEYVNSTYAFQNGLAYTNQKQQVIMKADNTTVLQPGGNRKSVRIQSYKAYTGGLFLLDVERTPYGCGVWPAFWTVNGTWPTYGEIDIYEGVHLSTNNQVTWHTSPGCTLDPKGGFVGVINTTNCDATVNDNSGCAVTDQSYSSSGATLKNLGGGVFAMKWDNTGISVWFFPRPVIPDDIQELIPNPSGWGLPTARLSPSDCNIVQHFQSHVIVFNIAFCGDWAGTTYLTSGCPGTCNDQMANPSNFDESIWIINTLRVFTNKQLLAGELSGALSIRGADASLWWHMVLGLCVSIFMSITAWS